MDQDDRGEARRLLAEIEREIEAIRQVTGVRKRSPPVPVARLDEEAPFDEEAPPFAEPYVFEPQKAPTRPTFEQRLAKIAAS